MLKAFFTHIKPSVIESRRGIEITVDTKPSPSSPALNFIHEDNWILLPYVSNPAHNEMIEIELYHSHDRQCEVFPLTSSAHCDNQVEISLITVDSNKQGVK